jgi:hypothetical protein
VRGSSTGTQLVRIILYSCGAKQEWSTSTATARQQSFMVHLHTQVHSPNVPYLHFCPLRSSLSSHGHSPSRPHSNPPAHHVPPCFVQVVAVTALPFATHSAGPPPGELYKQSLHVKHVRGLAGGLHLSLNALLFFGPPLMLCVSTSNPRIRRDRREQPTQ